MKRKKTIWGWFELGRMRQEFSGLLRFLWEAYSLPGGNKTQGTLVYDP